MWSEWESRGEDTMAQILRGTKAGQTTEAVEVYENFAWRAGLEVERQGPYDMEAECERGHGL